VHGEVASEAVAVAIGQSEEMREGAAGHERARPARDRLLGLLAGGHDGAAGQAGGGALDQRGRERNRSAGHWLHSSVVTFLCRVFLNR
jgi:hypothetical protein